MKKLPLLFLLCFITGAIAQAQCPIPNNNFRNFGMANLTPAGPGDTVTSLNTWAGDYHIINVVQGKEYDISTCNSISEEDGGFGWPFNPGADPMLTLSQADSVDEYTYTQTSIEGFNEDFCGIFPKINYVATFTGYLRVDFDSQGDCDAFIVDSLTVQVTEVEQTCSANSAIPKVAGTYQSTQSAVEGEWTHYCDADYNLLLSLKTGTSGAVIADNEVSLDIGAQTTDYFPVDCGTTPPCFIDLPTGSAVFNRKWDVNPTTQPSTGNVGVKFYFTQAEYDSVNVEIDDQGQTQLTGMDQMWLYKVTNPALGQFPSIGNITPSDVLTLANHVDTPSETQWVLSTKAAGSEYVAEYEVSSFSGGGGGGASNGATPLPVELVYFRAFPNGDEVDLQWATASEQNNRGFEVQRSVNGKDWQKIGFIESAGYSYSRQDYQFTDRQPLSGNNYYRLKQEDFAGRVTYLPVQLVEIQSDQVSQVSIFPNPAKEVVNVLHAKGEAMIYNASGQLVKTVNLPEKELNKIQIADLEKGIYHLVLIRENGERIVKKLLK